MTQAKLLNRFIQTEWEDKEFMLNKRWETLDTNFVQTTHLEEIIPKIPYLDAYIKGATERLSHREMDNLTYNERAAVYMYTHEVNSRSLHVLLNQALCSSDTTACKPWIDFLQLLKSGLEKLPSFEGECWRVGTAELLTKISEGQSVVWWNISSCLKERDPIEKKCIETKGILLKIITISDKEVAKYSADLDMPEVLLMPGTRLMVERVQQYENDNSITLIHLKEASASTQLESSSQSRGSITGKYRFSILRSSRTRVKTISLYKTVCNASYCRLCE